MNKMIRTLLTLAALGAGSTSLLAQPAVKLVVVDMAKAYDCHANSYLVKPVDFSQFLKLMDALGYYWLVWNQHPNWDDLAGVKPK